MLKSVLMRYIFELTWSTISLTENCSRRYIQSIRNHSSIGLIIGKIQEMFCIRKSITVPILNLNKDIFRNSHIFIFFQF